MSTEDPKEQGAPERFATDPDDEDDTEGHSEVSQSSDPDFGSKAPSHEVSHEVSKSDDSQGGSSTAKF